MSDIRRDAAEEVAEAIEAHSEEILAGIATDDWERGFRCGLIDAARIAREVGAR